MAFRDADLISTCLADKRTMVQKLNFLANQVNDMNLRSLIQDMANIQNRHVQILSGAQNRTGISSGQIAPGQAAYAGTAGMGMGMGGTSPLRS